MEVLTFKVDKSLLNLIKGLPNRSEFIRTALLTALQNICPLCKGSGVLAPKRKEHWEEFSKKHSIEECKKEDCCHELKMVCRK